MSQVKKPNGRHFTEAARRAAALARQARREAPRTFGAPELFVVRSKPEATDYSWEIRKFGGVLVSAGRDSYPTPSQAMAAGQRAIDRLQSA